MIGYHVTTPNKLERYKQTGAILPPVRFWPNLHTAQRWSKRTGREIILRIEFNRSYPLPDHKPARWTPDIVRSWRNVIMRTLKTRFVNNQDRQVMEALKNSNNWDEYDEYLGRLCGIPTCCRRFFIALNKVNMCTGTVIDMLHGKPVNGPRTKDGSRYVMCPRCLRKVDTVKVPYRKVSGRGRSDFNEVKKRYLTKEIRQ